MIVQGVVNEEIFQAFHNKTRLEENIASIPGQLQEYFDSEILAPTVSYFNETLAQHLSGLKPNISEVLLPLHKHRTCRLRQAHTALRPEVVAWRSESSPLQCVSPVSPRHGTLLVWLPGQPCSTSVSRPFCLLCFLRVPYLAPYRPPPLT